MFNWLCVWLSLVLAASLPVVVQCSDSKPDVKKGKGKKPKPSETSSESASKRVKTRKGHKMSPDDEDGATRNKGAQGKKKPSLRSKTPLSGRNRPYQPPPAHERPRHPGYEAPVEPMEENNTCRQVELFGNAPNINF